MATKDSTFELDDVLRRATVVAGMRMVDARTIREGDRNTVWRCRVAHADRAESRSGRGHEAMLEGSGFRLEGSTVIVKAASSASRFTRTELAALKCFSEIPTLRRFSPALLGSEADGALLVLEDLGAEATTLAKLLEGNDRTAAEHALAGTAHALGSLHAHAASHVTRFQQLLGESESAGQRQAREFRQLRPALDRFFTRASLSFSDAAWRELADVVVSLLEKPAAFSTITVGDMAPSNVVLTDRGPVFIDLEYAGVRHALYDATFWRTICPVPPGVAAKLDEAYCAGWADADRSLRPADFERQLVCLNAHRLFWTLTWNCDALFDADRDWVPGTSARAVVTRYAETFVEVTQRANLLPTISTLASELADVMRQSWAQAALAVFPVFQD